MSQPVSAPLDVIRVFLDLFCGRGDVDAIMALLTPGARLIGTGAHERFADPVAARAGFEAERASLPVPFAYALVDAYVREHGETAWAETDLVLTAQTEPVPYVLPPFRWTWFLSRSPEAPGGWLIEQMHCSVAWATQEDHESVPRSEMEEQKRALEAVIAERTEALQRSLEDLRRAQRRLVQQEKLASLGALTAGIAHEIKNPLNFVNNFSNLLRELVDELRTELDAARENRVAEVLPTLAPLLDDLATNAGKVHEHGQRADTIVRSMMEHARGRTEPPRRIPLNSLVEEYAALAVGGRKGGAAGAELLQVYDPDAGEVEGVQQDLGRVVVNLVSNALDAVQERAGAGGDGAYTPRVEVRTRREGDAIRVEVRDNGVGIAEGALERVFEPFFTTKPTGRGNVGLGLSLSRDIVAGHGGVLEVESEVDAGSVFTVTLPIAPEEG